KTASLRNCRAKNGTPATHPLSGREMRKAQYDRGPIRIIKHVSDLPKSSALPLVNPASSRALRPSGVKWPHQVLRGARLSDRDLRHRRRAVRGADSQARDGGRRGWAAEKSTALDAWAAHVRAVIEGGTTVSNISTLPRSA